MSEQDLTKSEIKAGVVTALKAALAKHEAALIEAAAAEAAGNRKLAKTGDDRMVPMPIDKNAMSGYGPQVPGVGNQAPGMAKDEDAQKDKIRSQHYDKPDVDTIPNEYHGVKPKTHKEIDETRGSVKKDESSDVPTCPNCGGQGGFMGGLGNRTHFKCRDCGATFSEAPKSKPKKKSKSIKKEEMDKVTPPDVSEAVVHKLKDEYGHDKAGKEKAFATAWKIHNDKAAKKAEIETVPTATVIDKPAKGAKLPDKEVDIAAPGSGGLKKDSAMPHKTAHPDTTAALTELRGIHQGAIPHPETTASLAALRPAAALASQSPMAAPPGPAAAQGAVGIPGKPRPLPVVPVRSKASPLQGIAPITGAERRAAGIGFLSNLISRFKGVGNKTWGDLRGAGPTSSARVARTIGTRMAMAEKPSDKKPAYSMPQNIHGQEVQESKKIKGWPAGIEAVANPVKKATAQEANKEIKGFQSIASNPMAVRGNVGTIAKPKGLPTAKALIVDGAQKAECPMEKVMVGGAPSTPGQTMPPVKKAAMAGGIPAAPKAPAAAKPPGAKMTMPKQPAMKAEPESEKNPPAPRSDSDKMDTLFGKEPKSLHPSDKKSKKSRIPGRK